MSYGRSGSFVLRLPRLLGSGHEAIAVENTALRLQLMAYQRKRAKPKLTVFSGVHCPKSSVGGEPLYMLCSQRRSCGATRALPEVLGPYLTTKDSRSRQTSRRCPDTSPHSGHGDCKPTLAGTTNPWRAEDARNRRLGANRLAYSSQHSAPAIPELEDVPEESQK